ncbi:hypothetical protein D3C86_1284940 [compost metagenome]
MDHVRADLADALRVEAVDERIELSAEGAQRLAGVAQLQRRVMGEVAREVVGELALGRGEEVDLGLRGERVGELGGVVQHPAVLAGQGDDGDAHGRLLSRRWGQNGGRSPDGLDPP